MGHSGGSDECIGCIRGRLAVLGEHDRSVKLNVPLRCPAMLGSTSIQCDLPKGHSVAWPHRCGEMAAQWWPDLEREAERIKVFGPPAPGMRVGKPCSQQDIKAVIQQVKEESAKSSRQHGANMALRVDGQALVIGRIVRYRTVGEPGQTWAALVTRVPSVNPPSGRVDLLLFAPVGGPVVCGDVGYDAGGSRGTWHWPPRAAA